MSEQKKSTPAKSESKATEPSSSASSSGGQNGKGDAPRNCFTDTYRSNFDSINWSK